MKNINAINLRGKPKSGRPKSKEQVVSRADIKRGMMGGFGAFSGTSEFGQNWGDWSKDFGWSQDFGHQDPFASGWQNDEPAWDGFDPFGVDFGFDPFGGYDFDWSNFHGHGAFADPDNSPHHWNWNPDGEQNKPLTPNKPNGQVTSGVPSANNPVTTNGTAPPSQVVVNPPTSKLPTSKVPNVVNSKNGDKNLLNLPQNLTQDLTQDLEKMLRVGTRRSYTKTGRKRQAF